MADKAINRTVEALNSNLLKLDNIQDEATKNSTDAQLRDRSTHIGTQDISTINDLQNELDLKASTLELEQVDINRTFLSTGGSVEASITDNLDGSVSLTNGSVRIFDNPNHKGKLKDYVLIGGTFTLNDNATNYIVVNYNSGNPIYQLTTNVNIINESDVVPFFTIVRTGLILHIIKWGELGNGKVDKIHQRLVKTQRFVREIGLGLSEAPIRTVQLTAGIVWYGANNIFLEAINSSVDGLYFWYKTGGNWAATTRVDYINNQYQGDNELLPTSNNKYTVNWIYRGVENAKHLYLVLGNGDYTLSDAQGSQPPENIPFAISSHAVLVGRVIVKKDEDVATNIDSAFDVTFSMSAVTNHNDLSGMQGGEVDNYWHLTASELEKVSKIVIDGDGESFLSNDGIYKPMEFKYPIMTDFTMAFEPKKAENERIDMSLTITNPELFDKATVTIDYVGGWVTTEVLNDITGYYILSPMDFTQLSTREYTINIEYRDIRMIKYDSDLELKFNI